ncbi:hypothetical protein QUB68_16070 [Microcoleus sp. A006_D1]|uniref:hypothetical protein n=1 Tax=Microcoleus sp. A006_D1 TaxID=3055267 RepID=UPI002FCF87AE
MGARCGYYLGKKSFCRMLAVQIDKTCSKNWVFDRLGAAVAIELVDRPTQDSTEKFLLQNLPLRRHGRTKQEEVDFLEQGGKPLP